MNTLLLLCINWLQIYPEGFLLVSKGGSCRNHRNPSRPATVFCVLINGIKGLCSVNY